ncbi:MAG: flavodoxin family protein [Spirochaetia bacterium]|nr:flavodoxin family protein [Spirochaetia bacterium]
MNADVFSLYGSPRSEGFSSSIHDALLAPLKETGLRIMEFNPYFSGVLPCTACSFCKSNERCVNDDGMNALYETLMTCSLVTVSSPVYFSGLSSPLKAFIDRCQFIWERKGLVKPKAAFFMAAAGSAYEGTFDGLRIGIRHFFNTLNASFDEKEFIFLKGSDEMDGTPKEALRTAGAIGKKYRAMLMQDGNE